MKRLDLRVLPGRYAVWQTESLHDLADFDGPGIVSVTRTDDEISVVASEELAPSSGRVEHGWRCLKVAGPLDFGLTGVLASLAAPLADAEIPIFVISTFDTDYVLVKGIDLEEAIGALKTAGHLVS